MSPLSRYACLFSSLLILATAFFYYPKWQQPDSEATISWDVSGYYLYLPATFIYHDLKNAGFLDSIVQKYKPGPGQGQVLNRPDGGRVMKYSLGQALQFLPWFTVAHALARPLGYPPDGFSRPYQAAISWGSLLVALLGLWVTRRNLLTYFSDAGAALALLTLVLATNYLNYTAIDGAMTHNWLFTAYSLLVFLTIRFYRQPTVLLGIGIGALIGWMMLTRPTEAVAVVIPLLWTRRSLRERLRFFYGQRTALIGAVLVAAAVGFLQLAYWKYATGHWLVYSYDDQGFSWTRPHVLDFLFHYRAGWLIYSPVWVLAIVGLWTLRRHAVFPAVFAFLALFFYVASAWDIWWYGGSLGERAMVQSYAVWVFPLAALYDALWPRGALVRLLLVAVLVFGGWYNLWWTHQAHRGHGAFVVEQMTGPFFWRVVGRDTVEREWLKLLDTPYEYRGTGRADVRELLVADFEATIPNLEVTRDQPISGAQSAVVDGAHQFTPHFVVKPDPAADWLRATVTFECRPKEWEFWRMTQLIVRFMDGDTVVREGMIRLQRLTDHGERRTAFIDTPVPRQPFDRAVIYFWNADGDKTVVLDDLRIESFKSL